MADDGDDDPATKPLPTFAGRLRVADFLYAGDGDGDGDGTAHAPPRNRQRLPPSSSSSSKDDDDDVRAAKRARDEDEQAADGAAGGPRGSRRSSAARLSPSPTKRRRPRTRTASQYAPPSTYAHLALLPDALAPNLLVLFVGLNPGIATARTGHAYAHPSNLFWKLLHSSGVLPTRCTPQEDRTLPARFRLGLTNIVARPSRSGAELQAAELDAGVAVLEAKARRWRPEVMCLVGKGIWDSVVRVRRRRQQAQQGGPGGPGARRAAGPAPHAVFSYGWQDEQANMGVPGDGDGDGDGGGEDDDVADGVRRDPGWKGARVFVASSTSGLAATLLPAQKEAIWRELGVWVEQRRKEMAAGLQDDAGTSSR